MPSLTNLKLVLAGAPHLRASHSSRKWMWGFFFCLLPVLLASFVAYGFDTLRIFLLAAGSAVAFESATRPRFRIANSLSIAALLTFLTPQTVDWRMVLLSSFTAVVIAQEFFGGFGQYVFHPALAGLAVSFYFFREEAAASFLATPSCAVAAYLGGLFLLFKKWARWEPAVFFLAGAWAVSLAAGTSAIVPFLSGVLLLGAFFLATDGPTSPMSMGGRMVSAFLAGALAVLLGRTTSAGAGLVYALLVMNAATPLVDVMFRPKRTG